MSLILEALRKSEAERRRGQVPDVAAELPPAPAAHSRRSPAWLWPAIVAGVLALLGAFWWSLRDASPPVPAAPLPQQANAETEAAPPALVVRSRPAPPAIAPSQAQTQARPGPEPAAPPASVATAPQPRPPQPSVAPAPPPMVAPPPPAPEDIPTTTASRTELTMHVWDESAARRFVILNGQRMGEGDRNGELQVVSIERDGVVVERNGQRSRLRLP